MSVSVCVQIRKLKSLNVPEDVVKFCTFSTDHTKEFVDDVSICA